MYCNVLDIPPQPALAPSLLAYEAALAGYFCVSAVQEAWDLVQEVCAFSITCHQKSFYITFNFLLIMNDTALNGLLWYILG